MDLWELAQFRLLRVVGGCIWSKGGYFRKVSSLACIGSFDEDLRWKSVPLPP